MKAQTRLPAYVQLEYLAEGAANIVYRILPSSCTIARPSLDPTSIAANTADLHTLPSAGDLTPPPTEIEEPELPPPESSAHELHGKLLRLHKDVAWIPSYIALYKTYKDAIEPLFEPGQIISQELVLLPPELILQCNTALKIAESSSWLSRPHTTSHEQVIHSLPRPTNRHGLYLASSEPHGILIEDMSPTPLQDEVLFEIKPKWLSQSPNAPKGSKRCRTCALRAMRAAKSKKTQASNAQEMAATTALASIAGRAGQKAAFCPLSLVSSRREDIAKAVESILSAQLVASHELQLRDPTIFSGFRRTLTDFLLSNPLLRRLRDLQVSLDPAGVLEVTEGDEVDFNFLLATTLRDCTLFLKVRLLEQGGGRRGDPDPDEGEIHTNGDGGAGMQITAKLGDLDLKEAEGGKMAYWRGVERDLIGGGWYTGSAGKEDREGLKCLLEGA